MVVAQTSGAQCLFTQATYLVIAVAQVGQQGFVEHDVRCRADGKNHATPYLGGRIIQQQGCDPLTLAPAAWPIEHL